MSHPTDDVLKARLKTVGVCEYKFHLEASAGSESGTEWRIIDVGGSRSQVRYYWYLNLIQMADLVYVRDVRSHPTKLLPLR